MKLNYDKESKNQIFYLTSNQCAHSHPINKLLNIKILLLATPQAEQQQEEKEESDWIGKIFCFYIEWFMAMDIKSNETT